MYHLNQIKVYAAGQDKICVKSSIGHLVFSYLESTKLQVVYVAVGCRLRLRTVLQLSPSNTCACGLKFHEVIQFQAFPELFISNTEDS